MGCGGKFQRISTHSPSDEYDLVASVSSTSSTTTKSPALDQTTSRDIKPVYVQSVTPSARMAAIIFEHAILIDWGIFRPRIPTSHGILHNRGTSAAAAAAKFANGSTYCSSRLAPDELQ